MRRLILILAITLVPVTARAQPHVADIVTAHVLPRFDALSSAAAALDEAARRDCDPASEALREAYHLAFDAWVRASHLRFGPTEVDDRGFALAFWPDSRGATPRALAGLIADRDPVVATRDAYGDVSIAARGFHALEFLLFDDRFRTAGEGAYRCKLIRIISADIAATSAAIHDDWRTRYAQVMLSPGAGAPYRSEEEVLQEFLRALSAGLQFTQESRLGRPLGAFDRPRPKRAEAWRSGRSARHVRLSLMSLQDLAARLAADNPDLSQQLETAFADAVRGLAALDDPAFQGVSDPQSRLKVEVLYQAVGTLRNAVRTQLGPTLGVAAGFNALDGD